MKQTRWCTILLMMNRVYPSFALIVSAVLLAAVPAHATGNAEQAAEWHDAALSRRGTAEALQRQAAELLEQARNWRNKAFISDAERRRNFGSAGDAEFRAGEIEEAASVNFSKEADNWHRAADAFDAVPDTESGDRARESENAARESGVASLENAVSNFGQAAEAYSEANAGLPDKAANAESRADAVNRRLTRGS